MRFRVDPRVVKTIQMADGTRYKPDSRGRVGVAARHEDEMARSGARSDYHESQLLAMPFTGVDIDGRICPTCDWVGFIWATQCGRCGEVLE